MKEIDRSCFSQSGVPVYLFPAFVSTRFRHFLLQFGRMRYQPELNLRSMYSLIYLKMYSEWRWKAMYQICNFKSRRSHRSIDPIARTERVRFHSWNFLAKFPYLTWQLQPQLVDLTRRRRPGIQWRWIGNGRGMHAMQRRRSWFASFRHSRSYYFLATLHSIPREYRAH